MSDRFTEFLMSRSTALWRAPSGFWCLLVVWLFGLRVLSGGLTQAPWNLALFLLTTVFLFLSLGRLTGLMRDFRLVFLLITSSDFAGVVHTLVPFHGLAFKALKLDPVASLATSITSTITTGLSWSGSR
ncbi:hypothetical protein RUE5091_01125 [Ruegeria denitrificans]|uniref:Uncharacterized protein n=1 Tax=Ruegeria denitrificans TaxID=1715692 RepID=A0A0P1I5T2_9RHOB|nr:hypothetical protein RUE5091_01125 [Ruegeria denitrificans]